MQALAFFAVLMIVAGNILFFVLPVLFAVAVASIEEVANIYMLLTNGFARFVHGHPGGVR